MVPGCKGAGPPSRAAPLSCARAGNIAAIMKSASTYSVAVFPARPSLKSRIDCAYVPM
jgi:hypothetical protein